MKRERSSVVQLLKQVARLLLLLIGVGTLLNGLLTGPVFATRAELAESTISESEAGPARSAMPYYIGRLFQISPLPTPTYTPSPAGPTDTPTPEPPTNTPTPEPPTNTPTPEPPTNTPTLEPPTNTPTLEPPTNTPTLEPPTNTPTLEPPTNTPTPEFNQPPEITSISVPSDPVHIDQQPIIVEAAFTDPDVGDTHWVAWSWGDATGSTCPPEDVDCALDQNQDVASGRHTYAEPGVYRILLTVTDQDGASDTEESDLIVVYDSDGGFATGGGWIYSEPGWCTLDVACATAEGKATFGFVSKYQKGATAPGGHTRFTFRAGNLNFNADTYQWMVVNQGGTRAQFKGWGTINGELAPGDVPYQFMLWAGDDDPDTFRIKISFQTPATEVVVYDPGAGQPIGGGSIVINDGG